MDKLLCALFCILVLALAPASGAVEVGFMPSRSVLGAREVKGGRRMAFGIGSIDLLCKKAELSDEYACKPKPKEEKKPEEKKPEEKKEDKPEKDEEEEKGFLEKKMDLVKKASEMFGR